MAPSDPIFRVIFVEGRNVNHLAGNMKSETAFRISGLALSCVKMLSQSDLVHPTGRGARAIHPISKGKGFSAWDSLGREC